MRNKEDVMNAYGLEKLPEEGGFYRQVFKSSLNALFSGFQNERAAGTMIFFLLSCEDFSAFHKVKPTEIFVFLEGASMTIHSFSVEGLYSSTQLDQNNRLCIIQPGTWFAAETSGEYSLVTCSCFPGFEFEDFEVGSRDELSKLFPDYSEVIVRLSRQ